MPVLQSLPLEKGWTENSNSNSGKSLIFKYQAHLDPAHLLDNPSTIRAAAEALGLPIPYVTLNSGLLCKACNGTRSENSQNIVYYTAEFDSQQITQANQQKNDNPDPLLWKPVTKVIVNGIELPLDISIDGGAISNSAGVTLLERLMVPEIDLAFEITATYASVPSWWDTLRRTQSNGTNTVTVLPARGFFTAVTYTAASKSLRFSPVSIDTDQWNGVDFLKLTYRLDVARKRKLRTIVAGADTSAEYTDWNAQHAYLDCGFTQYAVTPPQTHKRMVKITIGQNGEEPREEMKLDGKGEYKESNQTPAYAMFIIPKVYTDGDYSVLPGVT